jgi:carbon monoxide dehydrogenase subunit G
MARIESKKVELNALATEVFEYLKDLNNLGDLLPEGKVSQWEATSEKCSFKVQNAYKITLEHDKEEKPHFLQLKSGEDGPLPFVLEIYIKGDGEKVEAQQICDAKMNPFLKMMAEKPLKNLFDHIADKLAEKFS